ncbi:MAG: SMP-30/gluconolactonase/LRE family protein [Chloroflexi bacterium]|nr:SMP-30/gluconolactonase/LRE family protein [Chloroflexota bacterium]
MTEYSATVLLDGLKFGEGPRWRDGKLWFSDMFGPAVMTVDEAGMAETIIEVPGLPSGLGWLPDGTLLIVSMQDRKLLRLDGDWLVEFADLSAVATGDANDMVVDASGRAYVGNFGADRLGGGREPAALALVTADGAVSLAAAGLDFPNGTVITPDGATLIVAESRANRLTAFTIAADGSLSGRRLFADLGEVGPDGICLDAGGGVWVSNLHAAEVVRVIEGGAVTDRVSTAHTAYACMLGGASGRTLFVCTGDGDQADRLAGRSLAYIEVAAVAVPHAGLP